MKHIAIRKEGVYNNQFLVAKLVSVGFLEAQSFSQGVGGMKTYYSISLLFQSSLQLQISLFHGRDL